MNIFRDYVDYLKDNPKGYWFKRKLYGWGWTPARLPGFVVTFLYIALVLGYALTVPEIITAEEIIKLVVLPIGLATMLFIVIVVKTGEPPKWQWGDAVKGERDRA